MKIEPKYIPPFKITRLSAWMDGGTIDLDCEDANGVTFTLTFVQHAFMDKEDFEDMDEGRKIPGRMYFNEKLIHPRSVEEKEILDVLYSFEITSKDHEDNYKEVLKDVISYCNSAQYLSDYKTTKLYFKK